MKISRKQDSIFLLWKRKYSPQRSKCELLRKKKKGNGRLVGIKTQQDQLYSKVQKGKT